MITRQSIFFTILSMIKKASVISNYFKITKGTVIKPTKNFWNWFNFFSKSHFFSIANFQNWLLGLKPKRSEIILKISKFLDFC